jgi:HEAT repeat protein
MVDERIPLSKTLIDLRIKELELEEKARVISELKARQDEPAIAELAGKLADDSWHLRELAVRGLSEIGRKAEQAVIELIPGSLWYTRACAAEVLGNVGSIEGIRVLMDLLEDSNLTVRDKASRALVRICAGGHAVWVARAAASRGEEAVSRMEAVLGRSRRELAEAFVSMTRDVELMKAPTEQVEKMVEKMRAGGESQDVVWEELTGREKQGTGLAGSSGEKTDSAGEEGGGEAGEHRVV